MFFNRLPANKDRLLKHWLSCSAAVVRSWHGFSCHYSLDITLDYIIQSGFFFPKHDLNYNTYQFCHLFSTMGMEGAFQFPKLYNRLAHCTIYL